MYAPAFLYSFPGFAGWALVELLYLISFSTYSGRCNKAKLKIMGDSFKNNYYSAHPAGAGVPVAVGVVTDSIFRSYRCCHRWYKHLFLQPNFFLVGKVKL